MYLRQLIVFLLSIQFAVTALANPAGGVVSSGDAVITQSANQTTIQQNSQKAIINWQSFNIGAGEKTHFQQPQGGIALNRINATQGPSQIYGQLTATGKIILVNQSGIFFGPGSYVNVGGIIASTSGISDQNFLAGKLIFDQPSAFNASIINKGTIIAAENGLVAMLGTGVSNDGLIQAQTGNVILASGNKFTVDLYGDQLINFAVDQGTNELGVDQDGNTMKTAVKNAGTIVANGGTVLMTAKSASNLLDNAINMSGVVQANSIDQKNGTIILSADSSAPVVVSGLLDASGKSAGEKGGTVKVLGKKVGLMANSKVDVSGDQGGGEALVGGNYQGKGPEQNAEVTYFDPNATIDASALTNGDGGRVILWADDTTRAYGSIIAQGGSESGNGGFVETSGHDYLDIGNIQVNLLASHGVTGTWLLDPYNVTISSAATFNGSFDNGAPNIFTPSGNDAVVNVGTLTTNLASANVNITTGSSGLQNGDITVAAPIVWGSGFDLILTAAGNIIINTSSGISNSLTGGLTLNAGGTIAINSPISLTGGTLTLSAISAASNAQGITTGSAGTISVNNFILSQGGWYQVNASLPSFSATNNFQAISTSGVDQVQFVRALSGDGSSGSPYLLTDIYGVQGVGSNQFMTAKYYQLNNNINAASTSTWNNGYGFKPIGLRTPGLSFGGNFSGGNYAIDGVYIKIDSGSEVGSIGSFFGSILAAGVVKDLGLTNLNLVYNLSNAASPLAISNFGLIDNVYTTGSISLGVANTIGGLVQSTRSGSTISNSHSAMNITVLNGVSGNTLIGGLVGSMLGGTIDSSYAAGTITNNGTLNLSIGEIGGLVGRMQSGQASVVRNSFSDVSINAGVVNYAGGLVGGSYGGTIEKSFSLGAISNATSTSVGGLVGNVGSSVTVQNTYSQSSIAGTSITNAGGLIGSINGSTLSNSFAANTITGTVTNVGQLVGSNTSGTYSNNFWNSTLQGSGNNVGGTAKSTSQLQNKSTFTGWDFTSIWTMVFPDTDVGFTYPHLQMENAYGYQGQVYTNGGSTLASGTTVTAYINGSSTPYLSYVINGTSQYGLVFRPYAVPTGTNILLSSSGTTGNLIYQSNATTTLAKDIWGGYVIAGLGSSQTVTNSILNSARVTGALYSVTSNNLTLNNNIGFVANGIYNPGGNVTTSGTGNQAYNAGLVLGTDTVLTSANQSITVSSTITNAVSRALTINAGSGAITLNGAVGGGTALTSLSLTGGSIGMNGGSVTTSGAQAYSGNITIGSAALTLAGGAISTTLSSTLNGNGFGLTFNNTATSLISGVVSGTGTSVTKLGSGILTFANNNTYTGTTTISAGTLQVGNAASSGSLGTGDITNNAALTFNRTSDLTVTSKIIGTGTVEQQNASNQITLSGDNTYSGLTRVTAGRLKAGHANALGAITSGTEVVSGARLIIGDGIALAAEPISIAGVGPGTGRGSLTGGFLSSVSGPITLTADAKIGTELAGGTFTVGGNISGAFNLTLTTENATDTGVITSAINTSTGGVTKINSGTWTLSGNNTYSGVTTVSAGTLNVGSNTGLGDTSGGTDVSSGATLNINNGVNVGNEALSLAGTGNGGAGALSGSGTSSFGGLITLTAASTITANSGANFSLTNTGSMTGPTFGLTINGAGNGSLASSIDTFAGTLTMGGAGTWSLGGASTYSGTTTVSSGTLALTGTGSLSNSLVNVGSILDISGTTTGGSVKSLSGAGSVVLGSKTLTLTNAGNTFNGVISGIGGNLSIIRGSFTLGNQNTYTGTTTISSNLSPTTLLYGVSNAISDSSALTIDGSLAFLNLLTFNETVASVNLKNGASIQGSGGVLTVNSGTGSFALESGTVSAILAGTGALNKTTSGTVTLSNQNTYTGTTSVSAGTLSTTVNDAFASSALLVNGGTLSIGSTNQSVPTVTLTSGSITGSTGLLTSAAAFDMQAGTVSAILAGAGIGLNKTTSGTVTLSGVNQYTGLTTVSAGTLAYGANNVIADTAAISVTGGTLSLSGFTDTVSGVLLNGGNITGTSSSALTSTSAFDLRSGDVSAVLAGSVGVNKTTAGTVTLSGPNTYTGLTNVSGGILAYGANNVISNSSAVTVNGATLNLGTFSDTVGTVTLNGGSILGSGASSLSTTGTFEMQSGDVTTVLAGAANLNKTSSGLVMLTGLNTYTGITTINQGILSVMTLADGGSASGIGAASSSGSNLVFSGGTLQYTGASVSINHGFTLTGSDNVIDVTTNTLTLTGSAVSSTGALTKIGNGTLAFSGNNQFSGGLLINAGTVNATGNNNALGTGTVTIGSTLAITASPGLTIANILEGSANGVGNLLLQGTGTVGLSGTIGLTNALSSITGDAATAITMNSSSVRTTGAQNYNGSVDLANGSLTTFTTNNNAVNFSGITSANQSGLTINSGSGNVNISGDLGSAVSYLGNLIFNLSGTATLGSDIYAASITTSNGSGTTVLNGGTVTTTGAQIYNDIVNLGADTLFTAGNAVISLLNADNNFTHQVSFSNTGSNDVTVNNAANLTLGQSNVGGDLIATSLGSISQAGGITATGMVTNSKGGTTLLDSSNAVDNFSATNAVSGDIRFNNSSSVTTGAINQSGGGDVVIHNASGNITVDDAINVNAGDAQLTANAGNVHESASGKVDADLLTVISTTGAILTGLNTIDAFSATNSGAGLISLVNTVSNLVLNNITQNGSGAVSINNTGNMAVSGTISASGNDVSLTTTGTGAISQTGSITNANLLSLTTVDGANLIGNNIVSQLAGFNSTSGNILLNNTITELNIIGIQNNATTGGITVNNTGKLVNNGLIQTNQGNINLATLSNDLFERTLTVSGNIITNGGNISLNAVNSDAGTATSLIVDSGKTVSTGAGSGGVLTISGGLDLNSSPTIGAGNVILQGNGLDLSLGTVDFSSSLNIDVVQNITITGNLTTSNGANLTLQGGIGSARLDPGLGGVTIQSGASINSDGSLTIIGGSGQGSGDYAVDLQGIVTANGALTLGVGSSGTGTIGLSTDIVSHNSSINFDGDVTLVASRLIDAGNNAINFNGKVLGTNKILTLQNNTAATGAVSFFDTVTLSNIVTYGQNYAVAFSGLNNAISGNVSFQNTGGVTLGGSSTFDALSTPATSITTLNGDTTASVGMNLSASGSVYLTGSSHLTSGSITIGNVTSMANNANLTIESNGPVGLNQYNESVGITGSSLTHLGTGLLEVDNANNYSGGTIIGAGSILMKNADALGSGTISVLSGGSLVVNSVLGTIDNNLNLAGSSALNVSSANTFSGDVLLTGNASLIIGPSPVFLSGIISDGVNDYNLTKMGTGSLTLSGANSYSGQTAVNAGVLSITNADGLGNSSNITVGGSGYLLINTPTLSNDSMITVNSGGILNLVSSSITNPLTLSGSGQASGGVLVSSGSSAATGAITLAGNSIISTGSDLTLGSFSGAYSLLLQGLGDVTLTGNINNIASLTVSTPVDISASAITTTGLQSYNQVDLLGNLTLTSAAGNIIFNNIVSDSGASSSLIVDAVLGSILLNASSYTANGGLTMTAGNGITNAGLSSMLSNGAITFNDLLILQNALTLSAGGDVTFDALSMLNDLSVTNAGDRITFGNTITGSGDLSLAAASDTSADFNTNNSSYTGDVSFGSHVQLVNAYETNALGLGQVTLGLGNHVNLTLMNNVDLSNPMLVLVDDVTLGKTITKNGSLTSTLLGNISLGSVSASSPLNFVINDGGLIVAGNMSNSGLAPASPSIVKGGAGALQLSGTNTYTGATVINQGTLAVSNDSGVDAYPNPNGLGHTSSITVNSGGALFLRSLTLPNVSPITVNSGGQLELVNATINNPVVMAGLLSSTAGTINGDISLSGNSTFNVYGSIAFNDVITNNYALSIAGQNSSNSFTFSSTDGIAIKLSSISSGNLNILSDGSHLASFSNMQSAVATGKTGTITIPSSSKTYTVKFYNSPLNTNGEIGDPFYFTNFTIAGSYVPPGSITPVNIDNAITPTIPTSNTFFGGDVSAPEWGNGGIDIDGILASIAQTDYEASLMNVEPFCPVSTAFTNSQDCFSLSRY